MSSKFVIYVVDESIKLYVSSGKRFAFQSQYKVNDIVEIENLCKLLEKNPKTLLYIYLDTSEVSFEHRLFARDASRGDIALAIKCYLENPSNIISGVSKLHKIESDEQIKRQVPRMNNDAKSGGRKEDRDTESSSRNSMSMGRTQYIMFSINESCEVDGLKEFLKFITMSANRVKIIDFFQMNLIRSNLTSENTNIVTITIKISEDGRITVVASYGKNFIVNRDDSFDNNDIKYIRSDILSTIKYIETILAFEVTYVINILTSMPLTKEDIFPNGETFGSVLNIMTPDDIVAKTHGISISNWSDSKLDDALLAMIYSSGSHSHFMTNIHISKKRFFFRILPVTYIVITLFCFSLVIFDAKDIFVNTKKNFEDLSKVQIELNQQKKDYRLLSTKFIDRKLFDQMQACVRINTFAINSSKRMKIIDIANDIFTKYGNIIVRDYVLECIKDCKLENGVISLAVNLTIFNRSGYFEDMQRLYNRFSNVIKERFDGYNVTVSDFNAKLDSYKSYDSQDFTVSIRSM